MSKMASHLLNESPILVYPTAAKNLGINKAIIIQQIHFWLNVKKKSGDAYSFIGGEWWVYNSYPEWRKNNFPWLSTRQIQRIILSLENDGLLISTQALGKPTESRKWYRIDYTAWEALVSEWENNPHDKMSSPPTTKCRHPHDKMAQSIYTETSTENSTDIKELAAPASDAPGPDSDMPFGEWDDSLQDDETAEGLRVLDESVLRELEPDAVAELERMAQNEIRAALYDAVNAFYMIPDGAPKEAGARIGKTVKILMKFEPMPYLKELREFWVWWKSNYSEGGQPLPLRSAEKFAEHFATFRATKQQAPAANVEPIEDIDADITDADRAAIPAIVAQLQANKAKLFTKAGKANNNVNADTN